MPSLTMATRISSGWVPSMSITFFGPFPAGASSPSSSSPTSSSPTSSPPAPSGRALPPPPFSPDLSPPAPPSPGPGGLLGQRPFGPRENFRLREGSILRTGLGGGRPPPRGRPSPLSPPPSSPHPPRACAPRRAPGHSLPRTRCGLLFPAAPAPPAAPATAFPDAVLRGDRLGDLENFRRRFDRLPGGGPG